MEWWQAIILGMVQGLTEFLPVSSSGHLIITQDLIGVTGDDEQVVAFDVALHAGTLVAVLTYFREDLSAVARGWVSSLRTRRADTPEQRLGWYIILGTLPAIVAFLLFSDLIDKAEDNLVLISSMMIAVSFVFIAVEFVGGRKQVSELRWWHALVVGCGQAVALIPGTSRSGGTISAGMALGFERAAAARFSFLLSAPVVLAAVILKFPELVRACAENSSFLLATVLGVTTAGLSGYLAVSALLRFLGGHSLAWFAAYRIPVGVLFLIYFQGQ